MSADPPLFPDVAGTAEVRFSRDGQFYVHACSDATAYVRELFAKYGDAIGDLEVRRASLEDAYMTLVHRSESGQAHPARPDRGELR